MSKWCPMVFSVAWFSFVCFYTSWDLKYGQGKCGSAISTHTVLLSHYCRSTNNKIVVQNIMKNDQFLFFLMFRQTLKVNKEKQRKNTNTNRKRILLHHWIAQMRKPALWGQKMGLIHYLTRWWFSNLICITKMFVYMKSVFERKLFCRRCRPQNYEYNI